LSQKDPVTLLAPLDEAFQTWHPIDWGFNPFAVESFLAELMENLVVSEAIDITENDEKLTGQVFKTLGGQTVQLRTKGENTYVNEALLLGHMRLADSPARVLFLDQVPWIDLDIVEQLRSNFSHLESGPPIFNGSLDPSDYDYEQIMDTTTSLSENIFEDEENQTDAEGLTVNVNDPVNFPTTISPFEMDDTRLANSPAPFFSILTSFGSTDEDHVKFPANVTTENEDGVAAVRFYNKTSDNNASLIVFKLKRLLQSETEQVSEDGVKSPRQTKIVYINNKRVELESDEES